MRGLTEKHPFIMSASNVFTTIKITTNLSQDWTHILVVRSGPDSISVPFHRALLSAC